MEAASGLDKQFLHVCKEKNAKIMAILGEQDPGEVMEFQTTIQMVQVVVNRLLNGKKQITIDVGQLNQIHKILDQYQQLLEQYVSTGRLRRLLGSNRMRRKLEKVNSELHVALKQFVEKLKELNAANAAAAAAAASSSSNGTTATNGKAGPSGGPTLKPINTMSASGVYEKSVTKKTKKDKTRKKTGGKKPKKTKKTTKKTGNEDAEHATNGATQTSSNPASQPTTPKGQTTGDAATTAAAAAGTSSTSTATSNTQTVSYAAEVNDNADTETTSFFSLMSSKGKGKGNHSSIIDVAGKTLAKEHEHLRDLSNEVIKDAEGQELWAELFGSESFYVEWDEFIREISLALKIDISEDDRTLLKHVLDNSGTGHVSMYKWAEVLKGFGPVTDVLSNVRRILTAPWFHGFLTSREAELLLEDEAIGTYLIRFSRSSAGSFALAFVKSPKKILHILIQSCMPLGYKIVEEDGDRSKLFKTIEDILRHYHVFLRTPFTSDLPRESWFHGDVSSQEALELLQGQAEGTFLLRFSSQPGCFAASYVAQSEEPEKKGQLEIKHALIQGLPTGFLFSGEKETFPNLKALIQAYSTTLKHPLPNVVDDLRPVLHRFIEARKAQQAGLGAQAMPTAGHYSVVTEHDMASSSSKTG